MPDDAKDLLLSGSEPGSPLATMSREGLTEWRATIEPAISAGLVSATDIAVAVAYCEACGRLTRAREAAAKLAPGGGVSEFVIRDVNTGKLVPNPMLKIVDAAWREVVYYAGELRMTPKSR